MPNGHFETTLSDVQEAVKIMRKHTEDWGGNPERVGVMGCSAGGNLAIQAAVQFTSRENRPDFQILLYPFTTMNDFENNIMFGPDASEELIRKYSVLEQIKPDTPRAFIACSADDQIVPFDDSIKYFKELQARKIPSVLHIYPTGGHGWCEGPWFHYSREWKTELERWLVEW